MAHHNLTKAAELSNQKVKYLTDREISEITGIGLQTLRNRRMLGKPPDYAKIGRSVRYRLDVVLDYMESHRIHLSE